MSVKTISNKVKFGEKKTRPRMNYEWIGKTNPKPEEIRSKKFKNSKHNQLNVGRIALEQLVRALINYSLLQSGRGEMEPKSDSEVQ